MQWSLWAYEPPAEEDMNPESGQMTLCSGLCGPVSLLQRMIRILGQDRHHSMQWPLWACEPPAEDDTNIGIGQTPLYAVALVGL